jgi:hypothetical protein
MRVQLQLRVAVQEIRHRSFQPASISGSQHSGLIACKQC